MKNKGVIISILGILILGIIVTFNTRRLLMPESGQEASDKNFKSASADFSGFGAASSQTIEFSEEQAADGGAAPSRPLGEALPFSAPSGAKAGEAGNELSETYDSTAIAAAGSGPLYSSPGEEAVKEEPDLKIEAGKTEASKEPVQEDAASAGGGAAEGGVEISPLTGARAVLKEEDSAEDLLEDYRRKLDELETRIQRMRASEVSFNTDSYKSMADYEYRLWDTELNALYQDLLKRMDEDEAKALRDEEKGWVSQRDCNAHKASEKYRGGTLESLEYTASLAKDTRARTYELLDKYGSCLTKEEEEASGEASAQPKHPSSQP